jgi:hypothetical protein
MSNKQINLSDFSDEQNSLEDDLLNKIKEYNNFININFDRNIYNIINNQIIPENVILFGIIKAEPFDFYIWHEQKNNIILCGLKNLPIKSWYKIKKESELKLLIDFFKNKDKIYYNSNRYYLNSNIDFITLINYLRDSEYINKNIFIDEKDETNKIDENKLTNIDIANQYTQILKLNSDEIYLYTKYSNSKLRFENHNGYIICELNYNHIKLRNRYDPDDKFMPVDISMLLHQFELRNINNILKSDILKMEEIDICVLLAKDKKNLSKLKTKLNEIKKNQNDDIKNYIDNVIDRIKSDEIFVQIENDGVFRSFENSVDILIKTVYERFTENKSDDFAYINEILKYKVNNIFYSKLL